ncbi:MAG: GH25 family lysozyme [Spirochaetota bacterium]
MNLWKKLFLVFLIGSFAVYYTFEKGFLRFNYPDKDTFPVVGIDISHHQGKIDWQKAEGYGLSFVYIKATEGEDYQDPRFQENWQGAGSLSLAKGAYHFFTFCKSGEVQAKNFIATVPVVKDSLPHVVDLEFGGNCKARPSKAKLLSELQIFSNAILQKYGRRPIIYVTKDAYNIYLTNALPKHKIWFRNIFFQPGKLPDGRKWDIWQFSNRGRIPGITGPVDLNVFHGKEEAFVKLM